MRGEPIRVEGSLSGKQAWFVASGPGIENARAAIEEVFEDVTPLALVSVGYVGALDTALEVGQIFIANTVMRQDSELNYSGEGPVFPAAESVAEGVLLTIDRVAQTQQEKQELRQTGAHAVDMEAYVVAEEAAKRGVPFYCVRVVSDSAGADFPVDFNRTRRADGTFAGWKVAAQAGLSPSRWRRLLQLKRDADLASQRLAEFLRTCRFE